MNQISCFVLTSPASPISRVESVEAQLTGMGIPYSFVSGFTKNSPEVQSAYSTWQNLLLAKRSMSAGEVAVYLGHRRIWQQVIESQLPAALILEDDFRFTSPATALRSIHTAYAECSRWDMIKLFDYQPRKSIAGYEKDGVTFTLRERPSSGMVGYVISRRCCERLLRRQSIFIPVDEELRCWFEHKISIISVYPNVVDDGSALLSGSVLEQERQEIKKRKNPIRSLWGNVLTLRLNIRSRRWRNRLMKAAGLNHA